ncbi:MAG: ammonium transporter [Acidimicrobiia bacterium]|nr:ammonium transporter [Acidimicrobiia bacterium]
MESGDVTWILVSSALVLFMTPGLALFYGGMVRSKNVLNMLLMNVYCMGIVPIVWVLVGYSLVTGEGPAAGIIGTLEYAGMAGVVDPEEILFAFFAMTFAVITPALISGGVADRMKWSAWAVFVPVWVLLVFVPVFYWIYGPNGWLEERGSLDFAGGTVIHINAGVAVLALIAVLGKRRGWPKDIMPPHNLPLVMIGAAILWFGWFGFNAGSAGAADASAIQAFMNTFLAGSAGMIAWLAAETVKGGKATTLGAASGIVAGLVAITPAAGHVGGLAALAFGAIAGVLCFAAISLKYRFGYDDSLDVVAVHLVGGLIGGFLIGFFADPEAFGGADFKAGLFFGGGAELLVEQVLSMVVVMAFCFVVTYIIAKALDATIGLRVSEEDETRGLDLSQHAETAYNLTESGSMDRV